MEKKMDYKELIEQLRFFSQSTANEHIISCLYANAATAIETLLAEREAAVEELRGICWCCVHGKKDPTWSKMTTCEHMKEQFGCLAKVGKSKCPHWKWRGPRPPDCQQTES